MKKDTLNRRDLKRHVNLTMHDLSNRVLMSAPFGALLPFMVRDVVAGSKVELNLEHQIRTRPLISPAFTRFRQNYDYFFVPYSQLYSAYDNFRFGQDNYSNGLVNAHFGGKPINMLPFISGQDFAQLINRPFENTGDHTDSYGNNHFMPSDDYQDILGFNLRCGTRRLATLLGYGDFIHGGFEIPTNEMSSVPNLSYNPFRFAAYQKIYFDYFRNDKYESNDTDAYSLDTWPLNGSIQFTSANDYHMFDLRYRNYRRDYFTQSTPDVLPSANSFNYARMFLANMIPLSGLPLSVGVELQKPGDGRVFPHDGVDGGMPIPEDTGTWYYLGTPRDLEGSTSLSAGTNINFPGVSSPGGDSGSQYILSSSAQNVNLHRLASANQRFLERLYAANSNFSDQMLAIFGVAPIEGRHGRVSHIGGFSDVLQIADIDNTTNVNSGKVYGKINNVGSNHSVKYTALEDGIIMGIFSLDALPDYLCNRIDRFNLKLYPEDYYIPEFENLGKQPLYTVEYCSQKYNVDDQHFFGVNDKQIAGFIPRYDEYRRVTDVSFLSDAFGSYFSPFNIGLMQNQQSVIDARTLKCNPLVMTDLFGVQYSGNVDTDQFILNLYNEVKVLSPLGRSSEM